MDKKSEREKERPWWVKGHEDGACGRAVPVGEVSGRQTGGDEEMNVPGATGTPRRRRKEGLLRGGRRTPGKGAGWGQGRNNQKKTDRKDLLVPEADMPQARATDGEARARGLLTQRQA